MFDWQDYLSLAHYLVDNASHTGTEEAAQRSAISRAYYATFCQVRRWASLQLRDPFVPTGGAQDHGRLRDWLRGNNWVSPAQELGILREWRNRCDYDDTLAAQLEAFCEEALSKTEGILRQLGVTN